MKIILEETNQNQKNRKVLIETPDNNLNIFDVWELLLEPSLLGFGFNSETISKLFIKTED
jgi:hypothetical protein